MAAAGILDEIKLNQQLTIVLAGLREEIFYEEKNSIGSTYFIVDGGQCTISDDEVNAATKKAEQCVSCHGAGGISNGHLYPNLAGQKAGYLIK